MPDSPDNSSTASEAASDKMLDDATHGQQLDDNNASGQEKADEMDDSLRSFQEEHGAANGPAPASAENLPRELTDPSDVAYTLPEEQ